MEDEKLKLQIGRNIAAYRKQAGLTQAGLAEKLNYSDKAVSKWERGESIPDVLTLMQLATQFDITVNDLINLAAGKKLTVAEACEYLSEVGLCARDYINREVNASLSGGELKRIEIATVLARGTQLSVFDEPEAGIDLWSFGNLINVFENMHERQGGSILIISHQERILNIADKIIVIADGKITAVGSKDEVLPELLRSSAACPTLLQKLS